MRLIPLQVRRTRLRSTEVSFYLDGLSLLCNVYCVEGFSHPEGWLVVTVGAEPIAWHVPEHVSSARSHDPL